MSAINPHPVTKGSLLAAMDHLTMPALVRMGIFGISYQQRGIYASTGAAENAYPSQAILMRILTEHPRVVLPTSYPSVSEFRTAVACEERQLKRLSLRLGMDSSYVSRAIRTGDVPSAAPWALMAIVTNNLNGPISVLWPMVERAALIEAAARGIADLDAAGRWPRIDD